jgi:hypothetical protein
MALLPYMRQLPQDFYRNNYPVSVAAAAVPAESPVLATPPFEVQLGDPLPPPSGGGIPEAPTDGTTNARQNSAWTSTWEGGTY